MSSYDTDSDMASRVQFHDKATCISYIANNFRKSMYPALLILSMDK